MLTKVEIASGINKDDTPLSSEGGWVDADKVRFVRGRPQTIGGWDKAAEGHFDGIARGGHAWTDSAGRRYAAWGTASKLYALVSGTILDITPVQAAGVLTDPFKASNGSPVVVVSHPDHSMTTGQVVTFSNQTVAVGGLTLSGPYPVTTIDAVSYQVTVGSNATSTAAGGGNVDYSVAFRAGLVDGIGEPGGYGTDAYGAGAYGGGFAATDLLPRVWSLDNWGENLVAVPRGGALYEFQPAASYDELVQNGDFSSGAGWTLGTGWSVAGGAATAAAGASSDMARFVSGLVPGKVYTATFVVTRTSGSLSMLTDGGTLGDASAAISVSGTYSRTFRAPAGTSGIAFRKDASFNGTVDSVSVKLASKAYRVAEAPPRNDTMFVDPNRIVVLVGTSLYGDVYNQLAIRWCDREDLTQWTPDASNLAGDYTLSQGGRAIAGLATRLQNVIWTDAALYTMQFTGSTEDVFSFRLAGTGCGLAGALAKAEHNGAVFWKSKDNFFTFQGTIPQIIPCPIRRDVLENVADGQEDKIACGINPGFSEVWWLYPDYRDGTECSRYAVFCWGEDPQHWTVGTFGRSTWIKPGAFDFPIALGTDGYVYFHEKDQSAAGAPIDSFLDSSYFDTEDGNNLTILRRIVPDFQGQLGSVKITVTVKAFPNALERLVGTYTASANTEKIDLRATARQMKITLAASSSPSFWRLGRLTVDTAKSGATR